MKFEILKTLPTSDIAEQAEEFLLDIFGYGNYSFKKALSGWDGSGLQTLLAICRDQGSIKAIALALYDKKDTRVAIFGPIAVHKSYRNKGMGREIATKVLDGLEKLGTQAVYIGVKEGHPARTLYKRLGFKEYSGVAMRKLFLESPQFENEYFKEDKTIVREVTWADYPKFQALYSYPCKMKMFDWQNRYFSSKYLQLNRFLGVFPEIMKNYNDSVIDIRALTAGHRESLVGVVKIGELQNNGLQVANLDFFIHDNYLDESGELLKSIIKNKTFSAKNCYSKCLKSDEARKEILVNNQFDLQAESEQNITGFGKETIQTYQYTGEF